MHSLSCFFLLHHHHFEAVSTSSDTISISSGSINDDIMSDESDNDGDRSNNNEVPLLISENRIIEVDQDELPRDSTLNTSDEDNQFIFDEDLNKLICVGTNFDDLPQNIIDAFSLKTKVLDLSKNRFRSIDCIKHFPYLEELILDDNHLDDTQTHFPKLSNLQTLMINKNRLSDIYKLVEQLRHAYPTLTHLSLLGNEACPYRLVPTSRQASSNHSEDSAFTQNRLEEEYQRYRHLLIFRIPTLKFLDAREISPNERRIATQLGDILYSIAETKQSSPANDGKKNEKSDHYTPLPVATDSKNRLSIGKLRHAYHGEGSQGNKFVQDNDL